MEHKGKLYTDKFQLIVQSNLSVWTPLYYWTSSERKKKIRAS